MNSLISLQSGTGSTHAEVNGLTSVIQERLLATARIDLTPLLTMHDAVEREIESYYHKPYYRPVLGNKGFVQWVMEKAGKKAQVDREEPESRRVFSLELEAIVKATAKVYGKSVSELQAKRRGEHNEARAMAIYLGRTLGGHKLAEIGKAIGLENYSSAGTGYLRLKARVQGDKRLARRARKIESLLLKSQDES